MCIILFSFSLFLFCFLIYLVVVLFCTYFIWSCLKYPFLYVILSLSVCIYCIYFFSLFLSLNIIADFVTTASNSISTSPQLNFIKSLYPFLLLSFAWCFFFCYNSKNISLFNTIINQWHSLLFISSFIPMQFHQNMIRKKKKKKHNTSFIYIRYFSLINIPEMTKLYTILLLPSI